MNYKQLGSTLRLPARREAPTQGVRDYNFGISISWLKSRDSLVDVATGYGLDDRGSDFESR
jgi:hypothetical protein